MTTSDFLASGSLLIAFAAFIYTYRTNTKKYELTNQYRSEVLNWHADTVNILISLKLAATEKFPNKEVKNDFLSRLSANIERGRFYFPNMDKGDRFGAENLVGYQGYRNVVLDFLVFSYRITEQDHPENFIGHYESLQRYFTSTIFELMDPHSFLKETKKYTDKTFTKALSFEVYIEKDPSVIQYYL